MSKYQGVPRNPWRACRCYIDFADDDSADTSRCPARSFRSFHCCDSALLACTCTRRDGCDQEISPASGAVIGLVCFEDGRRGITTHGWNLERAPNGPAGSRLAKRGNHVVVETGEEAEVEFRAYRDSAAMACLGPISYHNGSTTVACMARQRQDGSSAGGGDGSAPSAARSPRAALVQTLTITRPSCLYVLKSLAMGPDRPATRRYLSLCDRPDGLALRLPQRDAIQRRDTAAMFGARAVFGPDRRPLLSRLNRARPSKLEPTSEPMAHAQTNPSVRLAPSNPAIPVESRTQHSRGPGMQTTHSPPRRPDAPPYPIQAARCWS